MKIYPLNKQILLRANEQEATTSSGLIISGSSLVDSRTATIIEVGPGVSMVKPGYVVFVNWTKAFPVKIEGKEYSFVDEEHIVAIVDKVG